MISKPIVAPIKGDPMRASWGAAVAERANECADAIDAMRGPGGLASLREPKVETPSIFPFKVRFEPSTEENAEPHDPPARSQLTGTPPAARTSGWTPARARLDGTCSRR